MCIHIVLICVCLLFLEEGELYTWGWNQYGQLGHGNTQNQIFPKLVAFFKEQNLRVVDVMCGSWNTMAVINTQYAA